MCLRSAQCLSTQSVWLHLLLMPADCIYCAPAMKSPMQAAELQIGMARCTWGAHDDIAKGLQMSEKPTIAKSPLAIAGSPAVQASTMTVMRSMITKAKPAIDRYSSCRQQTAHQLTAQNLHRMQLTEPDSRCNMAGVCNFALHARKCSQGYRAHLCHELHHTCLHDHSSVNSCCRAITPHRSSRFSAACRKIH